METPIKRADLPSLYNDYREQLEKLKATAETLTVTDSTQKAQMKLARETRLTLKDLRVSIDKRRKELGEDALRTKQRIDADAKTLIGLIEPLEARLLQQEKFAELEAERIEKEKRDSRSAEVAPFIIHGVTILPDLGKLTDEQYAQYLSDQKTLHAAKIERERQEAEAKRKREEEAEAAQLRICLENARLKKEAAAKEAQWRAEREAAAEAARIEREKAESEQVAAEQQAAKERAAREKVEKELRDKQEAEAKAEREAAAAARKAAAAPDREKLLALSATIRAIQLPSMSTENGKAAVTRIAKELDEVACQSDFAAENI